MNTSKRGISLIVLVITIIVMIILATAVILTVNGNGIINKANEAKIKSDDANIKHVVTIAKAEWEMMTNEEQDEAGGVLKKYIENKLKEVGVKDILISDKGEVIDETYVIYTDSDGKKAPIPYGFTVSTLPGETTVAGGLVIYEGTQSVTNVDSNSNGIIDAQENRNQFVWVPVDDYSKFERTTTYKKEEGITEPEADYIEPYVADDYTQDETEYNAMRASVEENGGFYIGRYEAGSVTQRKENTDNGTTKLVVQKNRFVYNFVAWGKNMTDTTSDITNDRSYNKNQGSGAVKLSRNMYKNSVSVVSTLCYGVQWDAALRFISTNDDHVDYATEGEGSYASSGLINTGSNENYSANNIYDMAGNVWEWTMESHSEQKRVERGGSYVDEYYDEPASSRSSGETDYADRFEGFRLALYIK